GRLSAEVVKRKVGPRTKTCATSSGQDDATIPVACMSSDTASLDQQAEIRTYTREDHHVVSEMAGTKKKEEEREPFGKRMARLRKLAGYSQRTLAAELGISYRMV